MAKVSGALARRGWTLRITRAAPILTTSSGLWGTRLKLAPLTIICAISESSWRGELFGRQRLLHSFQPLVHFTQRLLNGTQPVQHLLIVPRICCIAAVSGIRRLFL